MIEKERSGLEQRRSLTQSADACHIGRGRLAWPDLVRAVALLWIVLNHVAERLFGYPYIANPDPDWPSLAARLAQLRPLTGYGVWSIPVNVLRYVGWSGDQGVQLFLIMSGFGLTWSLLGRYEGKPLPLVNFYRRRAGRIYPLWWGAHIFFVASWLLVGWGLSITDPAFYLSMAGIRLTPNLFYYFSPAWWYIGLLLQLYLIFPVLWEGLRRRGPLWLLGMSCAIAFAARAIGLALFNGYLDEWQRGAIFITRLPEFVFGICLAAWLHRAPARTDRILRAPATLGLALAGYITGTVLSLTLPGMAVAPFLLGTSALVLLYAALAGSDRWRGLGVAAWTWLGRHSYSLFLLHHPFILLLVPSGPASTARRTVAGIATAMVLTVVGAVILERAVDWAQAMLNRWGQKWGRAGAALRVLALGVAIMALLVCAELFVRRAAPQEVLGWGERPSLEPDTTFGWRLKPSRETRLRWESYDYRVTANSLGFPGREYPRDKGPQSIRILVTGDAFTSAEGVDTDQAWPRLLEADLTTRRPDRDIQVMNFAITGYGPDQYAAVVKEFAPVFHPDLIIIGFFVNDYQDVLWSDDDFRQSIGFELSPQDGLYSIAQLAHLRQGLRLQLREPLTELVSGKPRPHGYFLGGFAFLERDGPVSDTSSQQQVTQRLVQIRTVAASTNARVALAMIPAPAQICGPGQLDYYPRHVNLSDSARFDLELPQRVTRQQAEKLELGYYDLRSTLDSVNGCPYQESNMHWTAAGHQAVAAYLANVLVDDGYIQ